uniref:Variant surface glycoprotein 1125.320 n=1 Tax=Trypanosoma brucei TaxID=5691 RepID=A0A1J0R5N5_9TRYP|nr:variant surface glycoprotein 1125.320 [Trypanosoma brucei]
MLRSVLTALGAIVTVRLCKAAFSDGDNADVGRAACAIVQLGDAELAADTGAVSDGGALDTFLAINMTLSDKEWQSKFAKENGDAIAWDSDDNTHKKSNPEWAAKWPKWLTARQNIKDKSAAAEAIKKTTLAYLNADEQKIARQLLATIVAEATEAEAALNNANSLLSANSNSKIKAAVNNAIYGDDEGGEDTYKKSGAVTGVPTTVAGCMTDGMSGTVGPFYYTFLCLCLEAGATDKTTCSKTEASGSQWSGVATNGKAVYDNMRKICPENKKTTLSAANIRATKAALLSHISLHTRVGYLGKYDANCDGASANSLCVKYTSKVSNTKNDIETLPWASKLTEAATMLEKQQAAQTEATRAASKLKSKLNAAWTIGRTAKVLANSRGSGGIPSNQPAASRAENSGEDCTKHKTNATCTAANCKWEEKDGKGECKPKDVEGQTKTAGGEGAAGTTEKCEAKLEKYCKSPYCKWESKTCKDSSFLVNKKFSW